MVTRRASRIHPPLVKSTFSKKEQNARDLGEIKDDNLDERNRYKKLERGMYDMRKIVQSAYIHRSLPRRRSSPKLTEWKKVGAKTDMGETSRWRGSRSQIVPDNWVVNWCICSDFFDSTAPTATAHSLNGHIPLARQLVGWMGPRPMYSTKKKASE